MILPLIGLVVKAGVPLRFAKPVIIIAGVLLLIAALGSAKCAYDKRLIERHDGKVELDTVKADRKADAAAAVTRREDDARISKEKHELERVQENATSDLDRRLARHRCLRIQQEARRTGISAACT